MSAIDDLIQLIEGTRVTDLRWELTKLRAIRDWAVKEVCDFTEGDRVIIGESLTFGDESGWWPYREALAPGRVAVVQRIDFNPHYDYWAADVVLEREWSVSDFQGVTRYWHGAAAHTPDGYEPPSKYDRDHHPDGRKHTFGVPVRHLAGLSQVPRAAQK